jgi:hypothetical protein
VGGNKVAIPRQMLQEILRLIAELRPAAATGAGVRRRDKFTLSENGSGG